MDTEQPGSSPTHSQESNEKNSPNTPSSVDSASPSTISSTSTASSSVDATPPAKFDINARDSNGLSLLFISSVLGYEPQTKKLVESGADVNILFSLLHPLLLACSISVE